jgi:hypothetical protein
VPYGEYYVLSQENSDEDYFDRLFPIKAKYTKNLIEVMSPSGVTKKPVNSYIYGVYFNKVNVKDNTFRILNKADNTLKTCTNYTLEELSKLAKDLNIKVNNNGDNMSKKMYCKAIEQDLILKKKILTSR